MLIEEGRVLVFSSQKWTLPVVECSFFYLKERLGNQTRIGEDAYEPSTSRKLLCVFLIKVTSLTLAFKVLFRCFPPLIVVLYDFEINCQEKSASVMIHRHAMMLHMCGRQP